MTPSCFSCSFTSAWSPSLPKFLVLSTWVQAKVVSKDKTPWWQLGSSPRPRVSSQAPWRACGWASSVAASSQEGKTDKLCSGSRSIKCLFLECFCTVFNVLLNQTFKGIGECAITVITNFTTWEICGFRLYKSWWLHWKLLVVILEGGRRCGRFGEGTSVRQAVVPGLWRSESESGWKREQLKDN